MRFAGQRGAVHRHERAGPSPAARVDCSGEELFADARLALQEHGGVERRDFLDLLQRVDEGIARTEDLVEAPHRRDLFLKVHDLVLETML